MSALAIENHLSLALLEVANLAPALLVADRCVKGSNVRILGIESADSAAQCIKLVGSAADVREAGELGLALAKQMGSAASLAVMAGPLPETIRLADAPPVYSPLLGSYDNRVPKEESMANSDAIGLLETQGLVASLHATDEMLKSAAVSLVGKEKIGAAYVTVMIRGDVAAVQSAISTGKATVERLGGKLILADVIARPHPDLAALLPK
ncbi:MAG TPA: BMC domain-containing protein [Pirellulales bacterium]|jgi:microcompartment protein CcmL/EutN|nr:BMC domain-containing protein [Pirellulales bacterium]